ncbi:MAG: DNA polymerase III subunit gamma/tau [Spirochaetae bacterium HGW-Spirochaetae-9]|nr:MAG: DNA polymerase III subunit gamma/tau [Spirochaetae bacterium HGW-Spirochaetae-9]
MPYEVTATRKRPQSFEQLAGQEFVAATLEKSLETGRIAHAYLFSGPRGCGKTSTARILAKALNCEKGPTPEPCGTCDSCKSIQAGSAFDVIEIDGASNTSVENVRQIKDEVLFPPNSSRYKIYIIDEVHMLSTSAFNALLKTIEEPPPYVIFMFATTEQHKVPATIKSRCQQFTFRLVASDLMVELLAAAAADLGVTAEPEALLWIARESGGSVRDAYTLFDQVVSFAEGNITAALLREKLGLVGQDRMNALFGQFVAGDTAGALASLDEILSGGVSPEQFVADMVEYCRAILLVKNGITRESLLGAPLSSFDLGITEALSGERIERVLSMFLGAYRNLKESIDPRYELDLAVAKASHINSYIPPSDLVRAVGTLKRYLEKGAAGGATAQPQARPSALPVVQAAAPGTAAQAKAAPAPATAAVPASLVDSSKLPELKKALVADIRKSNVLLATTLDKSHSWRLKDDVLAISVQTPMECDLLKRFLGIVAELLALRLGSPKKVEVRLAGEMQTDGGLGPGESPFEAPGAGAGLAQASRLPPAFNERPRADVPGQGALAAREAPARAAPAREPPVSLHEKEAIGLVERLFKGSLVGYTQPAASQTVGQAEPGAATKKAPLIEAPSPTVEDDEALE